MLGKEKAPIIVIGTGSVGVKFINELVVRQPGARIKAFGGEDQLPYSREKRTKVLTGELSKDSLFINSKLHESDNVQVFLNNLIVNIDTTKSEVTDSNGDIHSYSKLVLATGSIPRTIPVKGNDLENVLTFRNLQDAELLKTRQMSSRRTVIVGGGLVGLNTAYAMNQHNTNVTVIESSSCLMSQLLDNHASVYVRLFLSDIDIDVRNKANVVRIEGKDKIEQVVLDDGEVIPCDTLIISIGIIPNTELAKKIGLKIKRGIVVDDSLQTSQKNIYAIGECAEHRERIYALAQPGFEQAAVLAQIMAGGKAKYTGSIAATKLGLVEYPVISIGDNGDNVGTVKSQKELKYRNIKNMRYRKLLLKNGFLQGVIATGSWDQSKELQTWVEKKQYVWPW
ncbi:MAG: NAD(P)/FAD-dependent oxidoreductase, partial [Thiotrichaceae bacterium]|nr:NAD(P)/FAD-dependent oxidoreductase [Thiotrichaceae bacterium]